MRPRFEDKEIDLLLRLAETKESQLRRQTVNFVEEQEHLHLDTPDLRRIMLYQEPTRAHEYNLAKQRLATLESWIPLYTKDLETLNRVIARLKKIRQHKPGRTPRVNVILKPYRPPPTADELIQTQQRIKARWAAEAEAREAIRERAAAITTA